MLHFRLGYGWTKQRFLAAAEELDIPVNKNTSAPYEWPADDADLTADGKSFSDLKFTATVCLAETVGEDGGGASGEWVATPYKEASIVSLFGIKVNYASVASTAAIISVVMQLVVFLTLGALADYGNLRKKMMMICTYVASACCIAVIFGGSKYMYWWVTLMLVVANLLFGFATVFYNAYLPLLVATLPEILQLSRNPETTRDELEKAVGKKTSEYSAKGFATGFAGQFVFLILVVAILAFMSDNANLGIRIAAMLVGFWAIGFSAYTFAHLKERKGEPLPEGKGYCELSIENTKKTIKTAPKLKQMFIFLGAYFIFSDGCSTAAGGAATFAQNELKIPAQYIMASILLVSLCCVASCAFFFWLESKYSVNPKKILMGVLIAEGFLPVYALFALTKQIEFYFLVGVFGLLDGARQAYTRSIFTACIPKGHESEFFAFYEVTDKGTAWLGPLIITIVNTATGSYRDAFSCLVVFFAVGVFILYFFDPKLAIAQREAFEKEEEVSESFENPGTTLDAAHRRMSLT